MVSAHLLEERRRLLARIDSLEHDNAELTDALVDFVGAYRGYIDANLTQLQRRQSDRLRRDFDKSWLRLQAIVDGGEAW